MRRGQKPAADVAGNVEKPCVACGEHISRTASLCKHCKSDQAPWRNELKFWAGVAGVLTLVASGIAFTTSLGFQLWQRLLGHEIAITNVDPFGRTIIWNLTGNVIYLKTIEINAVRPGESLVWEVHLTIPANSKSDIELMKVAAESWYDDPGKRYGTKPGQYAQLEIKLFEELKSSMHTDKYVPTFLMPDSESFLQLKRVLGTKFQTFDCSAKANFVRLSDGTVGSMSFPCTGAFRHRA